MLRIARSAHSTARRVQQLHPVAASTHSAAATNRFTTPIISTASSSSSSRLLHTVRSLHNDDDHFDPAARKREFLERARLAREKAAAEAPPKTEEEPAAAAAASASSPSVDAPTQQQVNRLWSWVKSEITYLQEHMDSKKIAAKKPKQRPDIKRTVISLKEWSQDPTEKAAADMKAEKAKADGDVAEAEPEYTGPTALQAVDTETVWDRRINSTKEALRWFGARPKRLVQRTVNQNESLHKLQEQLQDKVEEARENWETSQDPRVWKMRDMVDRVVGETDTGMAMGEIMSRDPHWNYLEFLKEMEEVMIPEIVKAFRVGDMVLLKKVTEGEASRSMLASFRQRDEQKVTWDDRILDIRGVDVVKASLHDDVPFIHLTFVVQHVAAEYDAKTGEIKDPTLESVVQNTYYSWAIKRDFDSPYYDWKIFEFHYQHIQALI